MATPKPPKANIVAFPNAKPVAPPSEERFKLRADGRYQLEHRYVDADGKRKRKSFYGKTQTEALTKRRAFIRDLEAGLRVDKCALPETVDRAWWQKPNETARGEEKRRIMREFERTRVFRTQPVPTIDIPSEV